MNFNPTEHPIGWFRDRYMEGTLIIKPPYQRKPVWAARQKCYLIESILMGMPIPEIYMQQVVSSEERTSYAIVDGQQRMRTILQFIGSETDPKEQDYNRFVLDKLEPSSRWHNLAFARLPEEERRRLIGYRLAVRYLNTDNDDEIREMFRRLNKFLTPLKAQELRNATYTGPFAALACKYADDEYWAENRIVTAQSIRRMGDVEFVSELLIGLLHGPQGGSAATVDAYYAQYEDYEDEFPDQKTVQKLFDETLKTMQELLPDIKTTRWSNKTDFYTLFVSLGTLLRSNKLPNPKVEELRRTLREFADQVDLRLSDEKARVRESIGKYVRAAEKGANDKARRAERHEVLMEVLKPYFVPKRRQAG